MTNLRFVERVVKPNFRTNCSSSGISNWFCQLMYSVPLLVFIAFNANVSSFTSVLLLFHAWVVLSIPQCLLRLHLIAILLLFKSISRIWRIFRLEFDRNLLILSRTYNSLLNKSSLFLCLHIIFVPRGILCSMLEMMKYCHIGWHSFVMGQFLKKQGIRGSQ